jgi:hypothetical protein
LGQIASNRHFASQPQQISPASINVARYHRKLFIQVPKCTTSKSQSAAFFVHETPELWQRAQEFPGNENSRHIKQANAGRFSLILLVFAFHRQLLRKARHLLET